MNLYVIQRQVYTSLDLLSDLGGLRDILIIFGAIIFERVQGNGLMLSIVEAIFKVEENTEVESEHSSATSSINRRLERIRERKPFQNFKLSCCARALFSYCVDAKEKRRVRTAFKRVRPQRDITKMFRAFFEFKILKKIFLTKLERQLLKNNKMFTLGSCNESDSKSDSEIDCKSNYEGKVQSEFFMTLLEQT